MKLNLSKKLMLFMLSSVIFAVVLGGILAFLLSRNTLIENTKRQLQSISILKLDFINNFIEDAKGHAIALANNDIKREQMISLLSLGGDDNKRIVKSYFSEAIKDNQEFIDVFLINKDGVVVASSNNSDEGKIRDQEEYFIKGLEKTTVQSFYFDPSFLKTVVIISTPVKDKNTKSQGVLVHVLSTDQLSNLMVQRSGLGKTGETFLVNSSNIVVTELLKESSASRNKALFLPQINNCLKGKSLLGNYTDYHGDRVFGYWYWYPELKSCLVTKIDYSEVFAPLNSLIVTLVLLLLLITLIISIFSYFGARNIVKPIIKLRDAAIKIKDGDFNAKADADSNDEIADVGLAFNEMVSKVQELYLGLEQKVTERTHELEQAKNSLGGQVTELEDNKAAMLNILEDARILEEELKEEKQGVEKKVLERTRELSEEKIKLQSSISSLTVGFIMTDRNNNIVVINKAARSLLCASSTSPLATVQNCTLAHIEDELKGAIDLAALINRSVDERNALLVKELAFQSRFLKIIITPITELADVLGTVILIDDISEAKILDRSKDEFFSIASHELRTPLTAIRGNSALIKQYYWDKLIDKDLQEMIGDIHESSIRLIEIVNDFLDMSRLELGKIVFNKEAVDITQVIQSVIKEYQTTGSIKMLYLKFNPPQNPAPKALADAGRLKQVLINLIGNAIKFTEKGGITLDLAFNDKFAKIYVKDTGSGIPEKSKNLLFRKFQQASNNIYTRDSSQSTGLGLYISKLMIEGMGGQIFLENSEVGKGTTFSFTLPVVNLINQPTTVSEKIDILEPMTKTKIEIAQGK